MEANEAEKEKVKKAILAGRVSISEEAEQSLASMNPNDPDKFTVTDVKLDCWGKYDRNGKQVNKGGFDISWQTKAAGFGHMTVYVNNEGVIRCGNEGMGKVFLKDVLNKLLDKMELDD
jgi:hypothetical protein